MNHVKRIIAILIVFGPMVVHAAPIMCQDINNNHVIIDASQVASCFDAGTGNISGNPMTDQFLLNGGTAAGYSLVSKDDGSNPFNIMTSQSGDSGTWSIDPSFWLTNTGGAIGFKFGTGNKPDEWFVFELISGGSSGDWDFENVFGRGGGLSHTNLYAVPEPGTLALFGIGLAAMGLARRKKKA